MPKENTTLYAIYSKTLKVTYEKGENVESIGKVEDSCNIYNNQTSCEITLPEINVNDESATIGWYENNNKVGNPRDKYTLKNDITLIAKAEFEPIIQWWYSSSSSDFHAEEYRTNIITATFLDNKDVPSNAVASWDVSANKNGSVMAWVVADESDSKKYHLYIGGESGVIANQDSSYLFRNFTALTEITFGDNFDTSNVTSMSYMFYLCSKLTTIDVSNFDTSSVTSMASMFSSCSSLTTLDVSDWDTSKVTNMQSMFDGCSKLTTLDVSDWDTSSVTSMNYMFSDCSSLTTLDVSKWNTSSVTSMDSMFENCSSLTTLDVSKWNTSSVTIMASMFDNCSSLTTLDVSDWDTSKVTKMYYMFLDCSSLTKLILCSFDTNKVTDMDKMFQNTSNLKSIYVGPNWTTENATTTDMFTNSGVSSVTQSDNCEVDAMSLSLTSLSDNNSISLIANADTNVMNYSFSNDNGETWVDTNSNVYTFDDLNVNSIYNTQIRANLSNGQSKIVSKVVTTSSLEKPSFKENSNIVTITYPEGCGSTLTCTYQKDNGNIINVISSKVDIKFTKNGSIVANVSNGTNTVSSSYTVMVTENN